MSQKTLSDGQSGGSKIAYAYTPLVGDRCYVDPMNSEAFGCYFFSPMSTTGGSLVGYRSVTETLKTLGDAAIAVTGHEFKLDTLASPDRSKGREQKTRYQDATGTEQKRIETTWAVSTLSSPTRYFVYAQWIKEFTRQNGGMPADPQKKTYYDYATSQQGGAPTVNEWSHRLSLASSTASGFRSTP